MAWVTLIQQCEDNMFHLQPPLIQLLLVWRLRTPRGRGRLRPPASINSYTQKLVQHLAQLDLCSRLKQCMHP
jgi:hypothetical protein